MLVISYITLPLQLLCWFKPSQIFVKLGHKKTPAKLTKDAGASN
jgi:hypothetical protein